MKKLITQVMMIGFLIVLVVGCGDDTKKGPSKPPGDAGTPEQKKAGDFGPKPLPTPQKKDN